MNLVELRAVTHRYAGFTALHELDLRLRAGEVLGLLGHNGAGKTTTLKLILGLLRPNQGQVRVFGHAADDLAARRQLGFLPENVSFYPQLSGRETLRHLARLKGAAPAEVERLLLQVGLAEAADRRLKTYSRGMRQRLGLAQALLARPRLLLLDEPSGGLDPLATIDLYHLLDHLRTEGCAILLCSHALPGIEAHIDRAVILANGRLQAAGSLAELRRTADLPTRVRFAGQRPEQWLRRWRDAGCAARATAAQVELLAGDAQREALLRTLLDEGARDIEVQPPSLEDLYLHYQPGARP
ncbi:ABC transporter ATP-binding protein [Pseudomonas citronellolis]|uniref:ABC transporter ATP-binding protein n=1 Tax=Pseudomonas citronellolis TaxID=53408 RepID=UPI0023E43F04|nr:ABC transporter ATP-binding protein [Pseudomonas citronellolis]MDF3931116.1 ABC transporter ATP-binding protein [Pseudomonas citronellolis]